MIARELLETNLLKLEVLLDKKSLLPNESETLKAAEKLVKENFSVMVYTTQNILLAKDLENIGCDAIMPLGSQIGTGQGIKTPDNIRKIIEKANVPVIVDAGIRTPSDASLAMEMGCEAVLLNTSIAESKNPIKMAEAMKYAVKAGRLSYVAKAMKIKDEASPSSHKNSPL